MKYLFNGAYHPEYRKHAVWILNDEIALSLRTLKDASDNYLWRSSDDTILGKPVVSSPYMPNITSGASPILFGDLSFYWIMERHPLSVKTLSELFALENVTEYAAYERLDGKLILRESVMKLLVK